jgi:hypothetical protein
LVCDAGVFSLHFIRTDESRASAVKYVMQMAKKALVAEIAFFRTFQYFV